MKPATSLKPDHRFDFRHLQSLAAFFWLAFLLAACSRLPPAALPQPLAEEAPWSGEVLTYRQLAKQYFLADRPPPHLDPDHPALAAHAAIVLRLSPSAKYLAVAQPGSAEPLFCLQTQDVGFEAVLLPHRSWWNPAVESAKSQLVLQHEQVHFALMEASARRLNRRVVEQREELRSCDANRAQAQQAIANRLKSWLGEEERRVMAEHHQFDNATSRLQAPQIQQWWYDRLQLELSQENSRDH